MNKFTTIIEDDLLFFLPRRTSWSLAYICWIFASGSLLNMFPLVTFLAVLPLLSCIQARATTAPETPKLTLPWGTYLAEPYGEEGLVSLRTIMTNNYIPLLLQ